jgi:hypothetical protein
VRRWKGRRPANVGLAPKVWLKIAASVASGTQSRRKIAGLALIGPMIYIESALDLPTFSTRDDRSLRTSRATFRLPRA